MKYAAIVATIGSLLSAPVFAALKPGAPAPAFKTQATLAGHPFTFELADALKTGPVVLYFYPAAFTSGCTVEAHEFAEATEKFKALGATVIGVSHDSIDTLNKFSVSECRRKIRRRLRSRCENIQSVRCATVFHVLFQPHLVRNHAGRQNTLRVFSNES
jgi:hypothetical protein